MEPDQVTPPDDATPPNQPGTVDNPSTDEPPVQDRAADGIRAAMEAERRKRQAVEAQLAELKAAEEARQRKAAEKRGEWQSIAEQERKRAAEAAAVAERARLHAIAARKLRDADDDAFEPAVDFALFRYQQLPADDRPDFGEWLAAEREGALSRFLTSPQSAPPADTSARATGGKQPSIPADCVAEAEKYGQDPEYWFKSVWNLPHRRKERGET